MRANLHHPEQNTTGDPRRGRDHWVFGRRGKPCFRCGTAILLGEQGPPTQERVTWWCPTCQAARSPIDPQARTGEPDHPQPVTLYRSAASTQKVSCRRKNAVQSSSPIASRRAASASVSK